MRKTQNAKIISPHVIRNLINFFHKIYFCGDNFYSQGFEDITIQR